MQISMIQANMDLTLHVLYARGESALARTAQKIATFTLLPLLLIASVEAIGKNLILINVANLFILCFNQVDRLISRLYQMIFQRKICGY